ncbi:hypothetical protein O181_036354 [Austropuccinia psidii MF-1]|uniref:Uncharacterized protein n=1 Tax=Austropuccinia psidii MF-1 TaxID=1389203 RepID=A0A9Q3D4E9_9BASI|nr:hypothetical protein [Austropuccinia psidii MF-1]
MRDRDCLYQDINKLFDVWKNMKPQPQGHALDNPYQEEKKPVGLLDDNPRSPSQYQDGDSITYPEKEALQKLPEASTRPKFSGVG